MCNGAGYLHRDEYLLVVLNQNAKQKKMYGA